MTNNRAILVTQVVSNGHIFDAITGFKTASCLKHKQ